MITDDVILVVHSSVYVKPNDNEIESKNTAQKANPEILIYCNQNYIALL